MTFEGVVETLIREFRAAECVCWIVYVIVNWMYVEMMRVDTTGCCRTVNERHVIWAAR